MADTQCKRFLLGDGEVGSKHRPCKYHKILLARIALTSQADPEFKQGAAMNIPAADFPTNASDLGEANAPVISQYRYTLRLPNDGYIYLLERVEWPVTAYRIKNGEIYEDQAPANTGKKYLLVNTNVKKFWIFYSPFKLSDRIKFRNLKKPDIRMVEIRLEGTDEPYVTSGKKVPELVEEFKKSPGHLASIRGYSHVKDGEWSVAKDVCGSEKSIRMTRTQWATKSLTKTSYLEGGATAGGNYNGLPTFRKRTFRTSS